MNDNENKTKSGRGKLIKRLQGDKPKRKARAVKKTNNIDGFSNNAIRRLAQKAGVQRISADTYNEVRNITLAFLGGVLTDAAELAQFSKRKTLMDKDVIASFKRRGIKHY